MHLIFGSRATPLSAFFEGMVRVFDWGILLLMMRRKQRRALFENGDLQRGRRVVDRYINEAVADFESEEADSLSEVPFIPRRGCAIADIVLGPLPTDEVMVRYEQIVPGAVDRIIGRASDRLKDDSEAEIRHFDNLCRQGSRGMVVGLVITLLFAAIALVLVYSNLLWAGLVLVGINIALGLAATVYVTKAGLRRKWFTGEFFPRLFFSKSGYPVEKIARQGADS